MGLVTRSKALLPDSACRILERAPSGRSPQLLSHKLAEYPGNFHKQARLAARAFNRVAAVLGTFPQWGLYPGLGIPTCRTAR